MVSKENERLTPEGRIKVPSRSQASQQGEKSPEGETQVPEGKKNKEGKTKAFPLGSPEGKKKTPEGSKSPEGTAPVDQEVPSGDKPASSGNGGGKQDISHPLKEEKVVPSEDKEEIMDEETKKFIEQTVGGLKKEMGEIKEEQGNILKTQGALSQVIEAIKTEKPAPEATPKTPLKEPPSADEVARKAVEIIKGEDEEKRKAQEREEAKLREREQLEELRKYCLENPEAKECKSLPELVGKIVDKKLEKKPASTPTERKEPELAPLEPMTEEKRKSYTEEQNKERDARAKKLMSALNITSNDAFRIMDEVDRQNITKKPEMRKLLLESLSPEEKAQVSEVACKDDVCRVKLKEGGIAYLRKEKDGKWKAVDEDVAEKLDVGPHI